MLTNVAPVPLLEVPLVVESIFLTVYSPCEQKKSLNFILLIHFLRCFFVQCEKRSQTKPQVATMWTGKTMLLTATTLLLLEGCESQLDLEFINGTRCNSGYYFNTSSCGCVKIRANCPNDCNGHGICDYDTGVCACDNGYGSASDISDYKALDCSQRTCPAALSWGGVATSATDARTLRECSGAGICNKLTGECECRSSYFGDACEFSGCPNDCSGNGQCMNLLELSQAATVAPLDSNATYGVRAASNVWDAERIHGCVCDSGWAVGLGNAEIQVGEFYGGDCSLRRCPSGDDPITTDVDESDCQGVNRGEAGNLCYVPCSNRGDCDSSTGICSCYLGFAGEACNTRLTSTTRREH